MNYPKPSKKKKSVTDAHLDKLWSKAVRLGCPEGYQAHHIIRRSHFATRWDIKNGMPLSPQEHEAAHRQPMRFAAAVMAWPHYDYLQDMERVLKPDFLKNQGLTENEYRLKIEAELKKIIKEDDYNAI